MVLNLHLKEMGHVLVSMHAHIANDISSKTYVLYVLYNFSGCFNFSNGYL